MRLSRLAIFWTLLLLGGGAALFLFFYERYTEEVDLGYTEAARRNPYLAAEQFLARIEVPARRADNISVVTTLGENDILFLASSSQIYNRERLEELLDWVENGGEAIVIARGHGGDNERDLLLDRLGLEITSGELDFYFNQQAREVLGDEAANITGESASEMMREHNRRLDEGESAATESSDDNTAPAQNATAVADTTSTSETSRNPDVEPERLVYLTSDSGASYALHFDPAWAFEHEMMGEAYNDTEIDGARLHWVTFQNLPTQAPLVQYDYGRGRLTLMTDGDLWQNYRIGDFDHAYFLAHLIGERQLVMITRPHFDSLSTLAKRYALEFFSAGLLALLAWIANRSRRFGPMAPAPAAERRSLLEHIRACGLFYWRENRAENLFLQARDPLLQKITGLPPHTALTLSVEKRQQIAERTAIRTGIRSNDIYTTLWGQPPHSEDDFTAQMRSIQIIEAAL
ncbi:DUF4350 domain-containing protein [Microbulbifer bruguierae]|uniref:DUF4350 domain-containing protein n=1 Tax=Microbulbifer bruguierae TaxID=3029061 RepID=A0ABY8NB12_9GAMM|nr:DUF4350 domain-containing protein [Microbulbifer bruguierae]WGL15589.1 DUF4350 domain-containing protein [Microbulbifer bruguierae]